MDRPVGLPLGWAAVTARPFERGALAPFTLNLPTPYAALPQDLPRLRSRDECNPIPCPTHRCPSWVLRWFVPPALPPQHPAERSNVQPQCFTAAHPPLPPHHPLCPPYVTPVDPTSPIASAATPNRGRVTPGRTVAPREFNAPFCRGDPLAALALPTLARHSPSALSPHLTPHPCSHPIPCRPVPHEATQGAPLAAGRHCWVSTRPASPLFLHFVPHAPHPHPHLHSPYLLLPPFSLSL